MNVSITDIQYYIPKSDYSVDNFVKSKNKNKIIEKTGINKKFKTTNDQYATDIAIKAILKLKKNNDLNTIDYLIYCSQSPEHILPGGASKIQKFIFKDYQIPSIDINLGCSGFIYSYSIAQGLILSSIAKKVLIVTSDTYSKYIDKNDHKNLSIFGDGCSATIVERSKKNGFKSLFIQGTDGFGYKDLYVPNSALNKNNISKINKNKSDKLYMDGYKVFQFTINKIPKVLKDTLKINKLSNKNIDYIILHQANKNIIESIARLSFFNKEKFIYSLKYGNTTSSSIPIAIYNSIKQKKIKKNNYLMICGFGVGLSWSSTVIKINQTLINKICQF